MRRPILSAVLALSLSTGALQAAQRTFVSAATGSDANSCTRSLPCRNFAAALVQTDPRGEVIVLDSGGYGATTINVPVNISSPAGVYAGISGFTGDALIVSTAGQFDTVSLSGLTLTGLGATNGVNFVSGKTLILDRLVVQGFSQGAGVYDANAVAARMWISNSMFASNLEGVQTNSAALQSVTIDHCHADNNGNVGFDSFGLAKMAIHDSAASGNYDGFRSRTTGQGGPSELVADGCTATSNSGSGFDVGNNSATAYAIISNSTSAYNGHGIEAAFGGLAWVSNSTITRNTTGIYPGGGTREIYSRGNNTVEVNGTDGVFTGNYSGK